MGRDGASPGVANRRRGSCVERLGFRVYGAGTDRGDGGGVGIVDIVLERRPHQVLADLCLLLADHLRRNGIEDRVLDGPASGR